MGEVACAAPLGAREGSALGADGAAPLGGAAAGAAFAGADPVGAEPADGAFCDVLDCVLGGGCCARLRAVGANRHRTNSDKDMSLGNRIPFT